MNLISILMIPSLLAAISLFAGRSRTFSFINIAGHFLVLASSVSLASTVMGKGAVSYFNFFYVDPLSAFFILTISTITFASSIYSLSYIDNDLKELVISEKKAMGYYGLFNLFAVSMLISVSVNNMGMMWVAIEMTTLISAFLVGFYNNKRSIEAAWKYIIICSVGIALALLGTILFYYAASYRGHIDSLNWTDIVVIAKNLDPNLLKIAFLFIIVGYGTKAGFVPMHTWLPDAHSQALAPISALLSAVLLETAVYAILRFVIIINKCAGVSYSSNLLVLFGLLSLGVSAGFILVQKDIKRLLAYSSVEHIGIISLGLGFGGALGLYGAMLHVFNHAVTKSLMFFSAGNAVKRYKTSDMHVIRGLLSVMPFSGVLLMLGAFALAGSPPFSIFISEIMILISGFQKSSYIAASAFLLFAAIIFGAMIHHFSAVVFGRKPDGVVARPESLSAKISMVMLLIFICVMGLKIPEFMNKLFISATDIIRGA